MENAIIIARCSTTEAKQDVTRQTEEMTAKYGNQFKIVKTFAYYQSGTKNDEMNEKMLEFAIDNKVENILVSEISRIGRKVVSVLQFIEKCSENKINVIIDNYNLNSLNKDKTVNTITQLILNISSSISAIELQETKRRLDSGRNKYIKAGGTLGRKVGSTKDDTRLINQHSDIVKFLRQGQSVRNIMKLTSKSSGTVQKIKKIVA
jgi:DNA invertase Pin-like site-specific DNA recombinase